MIILNNIRQADQILELIQKLKEKAENRINLNRYEEQKPVSLSMNILNRSAFIAGLTLHTPRNMQEVSDLKLNASGSTIHDTTFSKSNMLPLWSAILKLRYEHHKVDWSNSTLLRKIVNYEIKRGAEFLMQDENLDQWLLHTTSLTRKGAFGSIPRLNLSIGQYEDEIEATLDLNGLNITNTQILIAGSTGSGKSNLLAVLINEIRSLSVETSYPVNFLLFDYKGEFSDPNNNAWLSYFEVDRSAILDPIKDPLPFTPFKDFSGRPQNEINLYSTEMANAICAIDKATISANMSNRLSEAIINAYRKSGGKPVSFQLVLDEYILNQSPKDQDKDDSIKSVFKQLIRNNLFAAEDQIDLVRESKIIKMDSFPKDGPIAKAIVYFIISKLNSIYERLPKQSTNEECVELRHFTIIDEAHYMLGFENKPLKDLIAVGRNKGLSIILATQNMDSYKSEYFDFYQNAQYPLIMLQKQINDGVIKDLFAVSGKEFQEVKEAIASLQKGELIIKNPTASLLGLGKKFKKMKVKHLI